MKLHEFTTRTVSRLDFGILGLINSRCSLSSMHCSQTLPGSSLTKNIPPVSDHLPIQCQWNDDDFEKSTPIV